MSDDDTTGRVATVRDLNTLIKTMQESATVIIAAGGSLQQDYPALTLCVNAAQEWFASLALAGGDIGLEWVCPACGARVRDRHAQPAPDGLVDLVSEAIFGVLVCDQPSTDALSTISAGGAMRLAAQAAIAAMQGHCPECHLEGATP